jgi:hypothetical protein
MALLFVEGVYKNWVMEFFFHFFLYKQTVFQKNNFILFRCLECLRLLKNLSE